MSAIFISLLAAAGPFAVLLLMAVAYIESGILAGFFLPGDSLLFAAGVFTATSVINLPLWLVVSSVTLAAALGDQTGYLVGRRFGPRVLNKPNSRFLAPDQISRAEAFFARHGAKTVVLARFVPLARTLTPVIAGVGHMPHRRFTAYNLGGAFAWSASILLAGYYLGRVPFIARHVELVTLGIVTVSLVPTVLTLLRRRRKPRLTTPVGHRRDSLPEKILQR